MTSRTISKPVTSKEQTSIDQIGSIEQKLEVLIDQLSPPIDQDADPIEQIIILLTEIVQNQRAQQLWIESISEKLDRMIDLPPTD